MERKRSDYTFFYLLGQREPYAYSNDKSVIKKFCKTRNNEKFFVKKIPCDNITLNELNHDSPGRLLVNYRFEISGETLIIPITLNEKMNIEFIGNQATLVYVHMYASLPLNIFNRDTKKALRYLDYDKTSEQTKEFHEFTPDMLVIFYKYYGDLMKGSE